jgi:hypothetical protein
MVATVTHEPHRDALAAQRPVPMTYFWLAGRPARHRAGLGGRHLADRHALRARAAAHGAPPSLVDMRLALFRRLPRPLRWLWLAVLAAIALECAALALGVVLGGDWWLPAQMLSSALGGPLLLALLIAAAATAWVGRRAQAPPPSAGGRSPDPERPRPEPSSPAVPVEVAVGRRAGEAVAAMARSREGKAAIRQTARLARAIRAAAQPPPESDEPERRSGGAP